MKPLSAVGVLVHWGDAWLSPLRVPHLAMSLDPDSYGRENVFFPFKFIEL
jgi:hypothetical protein